MAEKENEKLYYSENKITVDGKTFDVTFTFPLPEDVSETAYDKMKLLINSSGILWVYPIRFDSGSIASEQEDI